MAPSGHETIVQTPRVECEPAMEINGNVHKVWWERPDGHTDYFCNGSVYVMNDSGKTVAKYFWSYGPVEAAPEDELPERAAA
jgi:hypothetical protein